MKHSDELTTQLLLGIYRLLRSYLTSKNLIHTADYEAPPPAKNVLALEDPLLTIRQAYLELNISRSTLNRLRKSGQIRFILQNGQVRIPLSEVEHHRKIYAYFKGKL